MDQVRRTLRPMGEGIMDDIHLVLMRGGAYDGEVRPVESVELGEHFVYDPAGWESEQRPRAIYAATTEIVTLDDGRRACVARHVS